MKKILLYLTLYNLIYLTLVFLVKLNNVDVYFMVLLLIFSDLFFILIQKKSFDSQKILNDKMQEHQKVLIEQERLSSLGQLIGGIAHNLKTPIMSISGTLVALEDLVKEYEDAIGDSDVTDNDHHEIAKEMEEWIIKTKPYLTYMTDVINAVKDQAVSMSTEVNNNFGAKELILRTQILMKDELKRRKCELEVETCIDEKTLIKGELNAIVQVLDNLIINSMEAYGESGGKIKLKIYEEKENVSIEVSDFGCGMPDNIKDKVFREMVTTKGKNGTGLGLYISYSTIKGKFGGDISFNSKVGEGTSFLIKLKRCE